MKKTVFILSTFSLALHLFAQNGPAITKQPTNEAVLIGGTATFSVSATGTGPLTYQWRFNGTNLPSLITTVAGGGRGSDGDVATNASLYYPIATAVDSRGNLFISDAYNHRIRKVDTNGIISTVAGNGSYGNSGDGGAATSASFDPGGLAVDRFGDLYIADSYNCCIRRVGNNGIITTVAGNGVKGYSGDGGLATNASLHNPGGASVDGVGNLYIADGGNFRIRKVDTNGVISTVAGNGNHGYSGDGGFAIFAELFSPGGIGVDGIGNLLIADSSNQRIRRVGSDGVINTVAGNGKASFSGDGGPAINASLNGPNSVVVDGNGNLLISDSGNYRVREVDLYGNITTVAGNGAAGYSGDGGAATNASLNAPFGLSLDSVGNLYFADYYNWLIRKVALPIEPSLQIGGITPNNGGNYDVVIRDSLGSVTSSVVSLTVLSSPSITLAPPNSETRLVGQNVTLGVGAGGTPPLHYQWYFGRAPMPGQTSANLMLTNLGTADSGNYSVMVVNSYGSVTSAPTRLSVGLPPGVNGLPAEIRAVQGGNVAFNPGITGTGPFTYTWRFNGTNYGDVITTLAGRATDGSAGYFGDGGAATNCRLDYPIGITVDQHQNLLIADTYNQRIRKVDNNGIITTIAGVGPGYNGSGSYLGDGGLATSAGLNTPTSVAFDGLGNLFIADMGNCRIRRIDPYGIITTIAGNGTSGFGGDFGPATNAALANPSAIAVDANGNLFIADTGNNRIRKVGADGIITTIVGTETSGFAGDNGLAYLATLAGPNGLAFDGQGDLFISDFANVRVREVGTDDIISTVTGNGTFGFGGDGDLAIFATLSGAGGLAVDKAGNLFIPDLAERVRKVTNVGIISTVAGDGQGMASSMGFAGDGGAPTNASLSDPACVAVDGSGNLYIAEAYNNRIRKVTFQRPALTISNVTPATSGEYELIVASPYGSVTNSVNVRMALPPLQVVEYDGGFVIISFIGGVPGQTYVLEATTSLKPPVTWQTIVSV